MVLTVTDLSMGVMTKWLRVKKKQKSTTVTITVTVTAGKCELRPSGKKEKGNEAVFVEIYMSS